MRQWRIRDRAGRKTAVLLCFTAANLSESLLEVSKGMYEYVEALKEREWLHPAKLQHRLLAVRVPVRALRTRYRSISRPAERLEAS